MAPGPAGATGPTLGSGADEVAAALGIDLAAAAAREEAKGEAGEIVTVPVTNGSAGAVRTVHLVGIGAGDPAALRKAAAALARRARDAGTLVTTLADDRDGTEVRAIVESLLLSAYAFSVRAEPATVKPAGVELVVRRPDRVRPDVDRAVATARAVALARDLTNTPSLDKTPAWLAKRAERVAAEQGLEVRVRDERELVAEGFGGIIAVGMGSTRPPRLIELSYAPPSARRHVVLVGKGITFDSGGLSLKTNENMVPMKTDMGGGAAVIGVMSALRELGIPVRVTGLVAAAENMPSGSAQRPGDVISPYGGPSIEVLNTDAEGRLVLADGLAYADRHLDPDVVIDIATLTGAAALALGKRYGALFTPDDDLAEALEAAARAGGERLWRMPLVEEYRASLRSPVADLRNIADPETHVSGGAIIAALFLREYAGRRRWAHLDIAGPARADKDDDDVTRGATGFAVRTLLRYLEGLGGGRRAARPDRKRSGRAQSSKPS
ncbi:MAG: leucyl aminopeptidase [Frankiaceae bacterium]